jgi:hypothetical protein
MFKSDICVVFKQESWLSTLKPAQHSNNILRARGAKELVEGQHTEVQPLPLASEDKPHPNLHFAPANKVTVNISLDTNHRCTKVTLKYHHPAHASCRLVLTDCLREAFHPRVL